jgi:hypothetical protein
MVRPLVLFPCVLIFVVHLLYFHLVSFEIRIQVILGRYVLVTDHMIEDVAPRMRQIIGCESVCILACTLTLALIDELGLEVLINVVMELDYSFQLDLLG